MRMSNEYFFGVLLIVIGLIFLARQIFNIHIPIFRIVLGLFFIYLGISIMFGGTVFKSAQNLIFSSGNIQTASLLPEYNLIFSSGTVNLTGVNPQVGPQKTKINNIFSDGVLIINPDTPVAIKVSSAFASAEIPRNASINFGSYSYTSPNYTPGANSIEIEANVVFGKLRIIEGSR
ncbi:MAG: hypothetical protein M1130_03250 [Actinobacteria bacterium]|nr:hypothetical protein [Actinomycetota bacterium]